MQQRDKILGGLTPAETSIIGELVERHGWIPLLDCMVEDGIEPAGEGFRTHRHGGRHEVVLVLKSTAGRVVNDESDPPQPKKKK
jgi:hypothetical protein